MSTSSRDWLKTAGIDTTPSGTPGTADILACSGLFLASALDLTTTAIGLSLGLVESNPVAAPLLNEYGFIALIATKLIVSAVLLGELATARHVYDNHELVERGVHITIATIVLLWSAAAGWNIAIITAGGSL
jgi:hypothetical protein